MRRRGHDGASGTPGANGLNALTAVSPAGEYCEHGGNKIEVGVDVDGNGSLGSNEVSSTHYACNGAAGNAGEPDATLNWVAQSEAVTATPNQERDDPGQGRLHQRRRVGSH
jgi:hypothetical protein